MNQHTINYLTERAKSIHDEMEELKFKYTRPDGTFTDYGAEDNYIHLSEIYSGLCEILPHKD